MESHFAEWQEAYPPIQITNMILKRAASIRDGPLEYSQHVWLKDTGQIQNYTLFVRDISMNDWITIRWPKTCFGYSLEPSRIDMAPLSPHNLYFGLNYEN